MSQRRSANFRVCRAVEVGEKRATAESAAAEAVATPHVSNYRFKHTSIFGCFSHSLFTKVPSGVCILRKDIRRRQKVAELVHLFYLFKASKGCVLIIENVCK